MVSISHDTYNNYNYILAPLISLQNSYVDSVNLDINHLLAKVQTIYGPFHLPLNLCCWFIWITTIKRVNLPFNNVAANYKYAHACALFAYV